MGKVVIFPKENARASASEEFEQNIRLVHDRIVEVTTEIMESVLFGCVQDFAVKVSDEENFAVDLGVFEESIKSLLYRQFGYEHPLQDITEEDPAGESST